MSEQDVTIDMLDSLNLRNDEQLIRFLDSVDDNDTQVCGLKERLLLSSSLTRIHPDQRLLIQNLHYYLPKQNNTNNNEIENNPSNDNTSKLNDENKSRAASGDVVPVPVPKEFLEKSLSRRKSGSVAGQPQNKPKAINNNHSNNNTIIDQNNSNNNNNNPANSNSPVFVPVASSNKGNNLSSLTLSGGVGTVGPRLKVTALPTHGKGMVLPPLYDPISFIVSSMAIYTFPPSIAVPIDTNNANTTNSNNIRHFLVYNAGIRYPLRELLSISLPYRQGTTDDGNDYALRCYDIVLHFLNKHTLWIRVPENNRTMFAELISDAYFQLVGLPLDMQYPEYNDLIHIIIHGTIHTMLHQERMSLIAPSRVRRSGFLLHQVIRSQTETRLSSEPHTNDSDNKSKTEELISWSSEWRLRWCLVVDQYLIHFASPYDESVFKQDIDLLQEANDEFRHSSDPDQSSTKAHLGAFDVNQLDLSNSASSFITFDETQHRHCIQVTLKDRISSLTNIVLQNPSINKIDSSNPTLITNSQSTKQHVPHDTQEASISHKDDNQASNHSIKSTVIRTIHRFRLPPNILNKKNPPPPPPGNNFILVNPNRSNNAATSFRLPSNLDRPNIPPKKNNSNNNTLTSPLQLNQLASSEEQMKSLSNKDNKVINNDPLINDPSSDNLELSEWLIAFRNCMGTQTSITPFMNRLCDQQDPFEVHVENIKKSSLQ